MTDDADAPSTAEPAVPETRKGWSEQDRRTLIITVVGGLAANIGTVILVGAAIALVRLNKAIGGGGSQGPGALIGALVIIAPGLGLVAAGIHIKRAEDVPSGWAVIATGWLLVLLGVMLTVGLAAGVK